MNIDILEWLQNWLIHNWEIGWCDPEGFYITTIDNPGWLIEFNVVGTNLEGKELVPVIIDRSEHDWVHCTVKNQKFLAAGGPKNLIEMMQIFINWATDELVTPKNLEILEWLQNWEAENSNGDWEHGFGVEIRSIDCLGWKVKIDIEETKLEGQTLSPVLIRRTEDDWLEYKIDEKKFQKFQGTCGSHNLKELLEIFINWAIVQINR